MKTGVFWYTVCMKRSIDNILLWYARFKRRQFEKRIACADQEQKKVFRKLVTQMTGSLFASDHQIDSKTSYAEFQKTVPLNTYESFFPYIEKILQGEKNIISGQNIRQFAKSSGTTNARSKYIPLPSSNLWGNHYKAGKDMLFSATTLYQHPSFLYTQMIGTSGSFSGDPLYPKAIIGDVSTHLISKLPWYVKKSRSAPLDILTEPIWQKKIKNLVSLSIPKDVQSLFGTPTWILHILDEVLHQTGKKTAIEVWPNLSLFFHGAVYFEPYKKAFEERVGKSLYYMNIYNASEGYFGFQYTKEKSNEFVLLTHHDIFYECVPLDSLDNDVVSAIPLSEITLGIEYALVITTSGGLVRYMIGDTVRFTHKNPYLFELTGRTKQRLNVFGEEVSVENVENALLETAHLCTAPIAHFTITTHITEQGTGHHLWCIEFEHAKPDIEVFRDTLDTQLKKYNSDYDAKRSNDYILSKPEIIFVKQGTFYTWLEKKGKLGGQHKVPLITDTMDFINELQAISKTIHE